MKSIRTSLSVILALLPTWAPAAIQEYPLKYRLPVIGYGMTTHETRRQNFAFRAEILSDNEGLKAESWRRSRPFVTAQPGELYAIRLYNPLPVRVAVNLTVDGVNTITGKPSGIADGDKWLIEPYSFMIIRGWQVNGGEARRFFFTDKPKSYAKWRGDQLDKDLSVNCGVIGAAFFWNQRELDRYWEEHSIVQYSCARSISGSVNSRNFLNSGAPTSAPAAQAADSLSELKKADAEQQAGTGMGERESHPTALVDFQYDTGMYKLSQALVIYYDFAPQAPVPNPFPALSYAPEMP